MKAGGKIPLIHMFKLKNIGFTLFLAHPFPQRIFH